MGYAVKHHWEAYQANNQPAKRVATPTRKKSHLHKKQPALIKLFATGSMLVLGFLFGLQLLVSSIQLGNQWLQLEQKTPTAEQFHQEALLRNQALSEELSRLEKADGLETLAREQLDYAAPNEVLVRLF